MTRYCAGCKMAIQEKTMGGMVMSLFAAPVKTYKFEDGEYCETCAKLKVDKQRKKIK